MLKVGITGQSGFIGTHLYNFLRNKKDEIHLVHFSDSFFDAERDLENFVKNCDTIVHLAAVNRHGDPHVIYNTNMRLVKSLITACENTNSRPHILFSSSTQEDKDNLYGKSKKDGRKAFELWATGDGGSFTGMIIPNVFGPFGNPYYNSVVATFCHQLTHGESPQIDNDSSMKLIYVGELVQEIYNLITGKLYGTVHRTKSMELYVAPTSEKKVSEILDILKGFTASYLENGILPDLRDSFNLNLFNTFVCYIDHEKFFPFHLKLNSDERGVYVETVKMTSGGQVSFSVTKPGITRGNHYHTRKAERFAVIKGKAVIQLRRIGSDKVMTFNLDGEQPSFVDMPVWHTHSITNVGDDDVYTIFWISEFYDPNDSDTFFENVQK